MRNNELMHIKYLAHSKDSTLAIFTYIPARMNNCSSLNTPCYLLPLGLSKHCIFYPECLFLNQHLHLIPSSRLTLISGLSLQIISWTSRLTQVYPSRVLQSILISLCIPRLSYYLMLPLLLTVNNVEKQNSVAHCILSI